MGESCKRYKLYNKYTTKVMALVVDLPEIQAPIS